MTSILYEILYTTVKKMADHFIWKMSNMEKEDIDYAMIFWLKFIVFLAFCVIVIQIVSYIIDTVLTIIIYALFFTIPILFLIYNPLYGIPVFLFLCLAQYGSYLEKKKKN